MQSKMVLHLGHAVERIVSKMAGSTWLLGRQERGVRESFHSSHYGQVAVYLPKSQDMGSHSGRPIPSEGNLPDAEG